MATKEKMGPKTLQEVMAQRASTFAPLIMDPRQPQMDPMASLNAPTQGQPFMDMTQNAQGLNSQMGLTKTLDPSVGAVPAPAQVKGIDQSQWNLPQDPELHDALRNSVLNAVNDFNKRTKGGGFMAGYDAGQQLYSGTLAPLVGLLSGSGPGWSESIKDMQDAITKRGALRNQTDQVAASRLTDIASVMDKVDPAAVKYAVKQMELQERTARANQRTELHNSHDALTADIATRRNQTGLAEYAARMQGNIFGLAERLYKDQNYATKVANDFQMDKATLARNVLRDMDYQILQNKSRELQAKMIQATISRNDNMMEHYAQEHLDLVNKMNLLSMGREAGLEKDYDAMGMRQEIDTLKAQLGASQFNPLLQQYTHIDPNTGAPPVVPSAGGAPLANPQNPYRGSGAAFKSAVDASQAAATTTGSGTAAKSGGKGTALAVPPDPAQLPGYGAMLSYVSTTRKLPKGDTEAYKNFLVNSKDYIKSAFPEVWNRAKNAKSEAEVKAAQNEIYGIWNDAIRSIKGGKK